MFKQNLPAPNSNTNKTSQTFSYEKIAFLWGYAESYIQNFPAYPDFYLFLTHYLCLLSSELKLTQKQDFEMKQRVNRFGQISSYYNWELRNGNFKNVFDYIQSRFMENKNPDLATIELWQDLITMVEYYIKKETPQIKQWKEFINSKCNNNRNLPEDEYNEELEDLDDELDIIAQQQEESYQSNKADTFKVIEEFKNALLRDDVLVSIKKINEVIGKVKMLKEIRGEM